MYTATCHTRLGAFTSKSISVLCGVSDHLDLTGNLSQLELPGCTFGLHWPYLRHNKIKGSEKERQRERERASKNNNRQGQGERAEPNKQAGERRNCCTQMPLTHPSFRLSCTQCTRKQSLWHSNASASVLLCLAFAESWLVQYDLAFLCIKLAASSHHRCTCFRDTLTVGV